MCLFKKTAERTAKFQLRQLSKAIRTIDSSLKIRNRNSCLFIYQRRTPGPFVAPREADAVLLRSMGVQANFISNGVVKQGRTLSTPAGLPPSGSASSSSQPQAAQKNGPFGQ